MATPEKIMKIAQWLSIETSGKTEETIRKEIAEKVRQPSKPPPKMEGMESIAQIIGRWVGEYEHMKNEVMGSFTASPPESTTGPPPATEKSKLTAQKINFEKTRKVAKILGIKTSGRPIDEVRKEIGKKTGE